MVAEFTGGFAELCSRSQFLQPRPPFGFVAAKKRKQISVCLPEGDRNGISWPQTHYCQARRNSQHIRGAARLQQEMPAPNPSMTALQTQGDQVGNGPLCPYSTQDFWRRLQQCMRWTVQRVEGQGPGWYFCTFVISVLIRDHELGMWQTEFRRARATTVSWKSLLQTDEALGAWLRAWKAGIQWEGGNDRLHWGQG